MQQHYQEAIISKPVGVVICVMQSYFANVKPKNKFGTERILSMCTIVVILKI
jgi:hypothetical protein